MWMRKNRLWALQSKSRTIKLTPLLKWTPEENGVAQTNKTSVFLKPDVQEYIYTWKWIHGMDTVCGLLQERERERHRAKNTERERERKKNKERKKERKKSRIQKKDEQGILNETIIQSIANRLFRQKQTCHMSNTCSLHQSCLAFDSFLTLRSSCSLGQAP